MNITGIINNANDGPGYHRIAMPLLLMPDTDVYITNQVTEEKASTTDVMVVNRVFPGNKIADILAWRDRYGFKLVVDIDDYWHLPDTHPAKPSWDRHDIKNRIIHMITEADVVTTTHSRLAYHCQQHNKNVHVIPNAIPYEGQFTVKNTPSDKVRIFWQGSPTHIEDVAILRSTLHKLYKRPQTKDLCKQVLAGYKESVEWEKIADTYTGAQRYPYEVYGGVNADQYYHSYQHADICVVPLIQSTFNSNKSNLKVLEAANAKLPCVVSEVNPYLGLPVLYASNNHDWYYHLKELILSKEYREVKGQQLHDYCNEHFNFKTINEQRKELYESIQQGVPGS